MEARCTFAVRKELTTGKYQGLCIIKIDGEEVERLTTDFYDTREEVVEFCLKSAEMLKDVKMSRIGWLES